MMVPCITLLRFPSDSQKHTINIDLQQNVQELKNISLNVVNNDWSKYEISFCGNILDNRNSLSSYGINSGDILHILEKPKPRETPVKKLVTDADMVTAFRTLTVLSGYRNALMKLSKREVMNKIIEATPGLSDAPAAISFLLDQELLSHVLDLDTATKIFTEYPILLQVIQNLLTYCQEEQADTNLNQASTSTGYSYSLDALSDDDTDDMDSDTNMSNNPLSRNSSFNAITAAQLAAAIANATNTQFNTNSAGTPSTPGGNIITNEMFSSAMQQAFRGPFNAFAAGGTPVRAEEESDATLARRWESQLHQMHEMGLINDTMNLRALRATSGEVTTAVELVLSMTSENDRF